MNWRCCGKDRTSHPTFRVDWTQNSNGFERTMTVGPFATRDRAEHAALCILGRDDGRNVEIIENRMVEERP